MKPTKNKFFCKDCEKIKMLFETEKKADSFIKFNKEEIEAESGYAPQRSYYCLFCGGWHITSIKRKFGLSDKEQIYESFLMEKEKNKETKALNEEKSIVVKNSKIETQEIKNRIKNELKSHLKGMNTSEKESFFSENINTLKKEIEVQLTVTIPNKEKLKELRQNLEINSVLRKQNGFQKTPKINKKLEDIREKEIEYWKLWAEEKGKTIVVDN